MPNEFILYAAIAGAITTGVASLATKNKGMSWIISVAVGIIVIMFFFPDPKAAKTIGDMAENLTLVIQKLIYAAGWLGGTCLVGLLFDKSYR